MENKNISVSTNAGVGKTLLAAIAIFNRVDIRQNYVQALYVVDSYESAKQTTAYLTKLFAFTDIKIGVVVRLEESFVTHLDSHILIGTPKELASFRMLNVFNMKKLSIIVFDDADRVVPSTYTKGHLMNAIDSKCQTLIMSSFRMSCFAINDIPNVLRCELFANSHPFPANIEHFFIECMDEKTKYKMLYCLCSLNGKMIIFFHVSKPGFRVI